ncbi:MAG: alanine racemase, partial [Solirubrobacterales bacterium]|nr:alanine racemase [Solirubrobacterales bacterium]
GVDARMIVLGALSAAELETALDADAEIVAWDPAFVRAIDRPAKVHVKLDSGMGRLGTRDLDTALEVVEGVRGHLQLAGLTTHFATSDDDLEFAAAQLAEFQRFRAAVPGVPAHAANSGATLQLPDSALDMVRCGIAIYGGDPRNRDPADFGLEPALALRSYVAALKPIQPGQSAGYGRRFIASRPGWLATLPIGYGDGVRRGLTNNCDVLIGGRRYPLVGTVSMDNITVDLGPAHHPGNSEPTVKVGDLATLIGSDGDESQTAEEVARRIDTINYEVLCGIGPRVPRVYHRDGEPA